LKIRRAIAALREVPFHVLALVLLAAFLVPRLPFFWFNPNVEISVDSGSYIWLARTIGAGTWPLFVLRTPGYPLLIRLVTCFSDRLLTIVYLQNLMSFLSSLALVYSVHRMRRPLALPAAIAMSAFVGASQVLFYDISVLSESPYTSTVILAIACIFMGIAADRAVYFSLGSALMAFAIMIRPAGEFLAVIYGVILAGLLGCRFPRRDVLGFAAPFIGLLLLLCAYNYATLRQFTISAFTEANLAGSTALFWEPDPRLPAGVNKALEGLPESYRKLGITQADLDLVHNSWDVGPLFDVYSKAYNRLVWGGGWGTGTRFGPGGYRNNRRYIRDVSMIAIRRHPVLYAKYVWVNMAMFFGGIGYKYDFYSSIKYRESGTTAVEEKVYESNAAATPPAGPPPKADQAGGASPEASASELFIRKLQLGWQGIHGFLFETVIWSWAYFAVMALSLAQLVRFRGRHLGAFLLLALTLIPLGAGLVVCLVEVALDRYSYPTQFIYYLSVALCPLLGCAALSDLRPARRTPPAAPG
jgi:hypothetical protein